MQKINISKPWINFFAIALLIIIVALGMRIFNLTSLPVFVDEAIYIRWSQIMANEPTLRFLPLSDGKQPLYMWGLMLIVDKFSDPLFAGRIVSVFSGIGTLVGVGVMSFVLFKNKNASLVAMLICAISPFAVFFDRMALVDSTLAFFAIWTAIFSVITAKTKRLDSAMITGFFLGAGLLTKSPALFFVILMPFSFLFINFKNTHGKAVKKDRPLTLVHVAGLFLVSIAIGYGLYQILRLGPNFHLIASRNLDYVFPITHVFENPLSPFKGYMERAFEWIWLFGPGAILLLVFASIFINFRKNLKQIIFLLAWILIPIMVNAEFAKVFTARYILYTIPFLAILAAAIFNEVKKYQIFLYLLLLFFIFQAIYFNYLLITKPTEAYWPLSERTGYLEEWTAGDGIKEISEYLKLEHAKNPDKQIIVGTEGYFGTLPDGLQIYMQDVPGVVVKGVGVQLKEVPSDLVESKKAGNKTYLVINKSRLTGDSAQMGLKLIKEYPKTPRSPGTHDFVQFGPQEVLYFFEVQ